MSFRYASSAPAELATERASDPWTLRDVDLVVPAGTRTAVVGETGAGKTTLGYLVARLYEPQEGRVTIDGVDVRDASLESLAATVGVVSQETYLFHASVRENLRFARPDATDEEIEDAARTARIHNLIASLPDGYDTVVGERGYRFSGGEKQRMAIARTVLRNPPVLVLDEATSSLDTQTEAAVQAELERLAEGRTTITIAHRLSTVRDADQIVVLDHGPDRRAGHARGAAGAAGPLRRAGGARRHRRGTRLSGNLDVLHRHGPDADDVAVAEVGGDDPPAVDERAVRAAVVEHAGVAAMAHDDRVVAGDALVLEADLAGTAAANVGDRRLEPEQELAAGVLEAQVVAGGGDAGRDRAALGTMIQQRERIDDGVAVGSPQRRCGFIQRRVGCLPLGSLDRRLGCHVLQITTPMAEQSQRLLRGP